MFCHLHVHTNYSLLDGFSSIPSLVGRVKELGMEAVAITDHGVMFGVIDFYKECVANGIKPILGSEVYVAERRMQDKDSKEDWSYYHLVLLAENDIGYHNLVKIVSQGYVEGFYRKPRVDEALLREHSKGIIALTGCIGGKIPQRLLVGREEEAREELLLLADIFGKDNLFVELQDHQMDEERRVMPQLASLAAQEGIGLVVTNDSHYTMQSDAAAHEVLLCVQTATNLDDPKRMAFNNDSYYVKTEEEMRALFPHIPDAVENTNLIATRCNVEIEFHNYHLPKYAAPEGKDKGELLAQLCKEGLLSKYGASTPALEERLAYELGVIDSMGFNDYFLIVWDFIKYAKDNGIPVGPGRGSAVGSLASYCLGITEVDPIAYNLIFERFLNSQRVSMPDIDIDFCYEKRQLVIEYVISKYGDSNVSQIITFGTFGAKNAIRDVGRSLCMSYAECDKVAKEVPNKPGTSIDSAIEENPELKRMIEEDERIARLIEVSKAIEGAPRHASTHAAGVVITDEPTSEYVPLYLNDGNIATQFSMNTIEELGLLKVDFLGLRTLTVIADTIENVKRSQGIDVCVDATKITFKDPSVYALISRGDTLGVFQLEGSGMRGFMQNLKPDTFEDIIAGIALYRPGPMQYISDYIANKNDPSKIRYLDNKLAPILDVTYGCMIYQEQVMQLVRDLAGFSMGDSDNVRRAMSKKKEAEMVKERQRFVYGDESTGVIGAIANGVSEQAANMIYDQMMDFASYAFNKSHAAAYAVISYQTAYLKAYYPVEFMAALLTSIIGDDTKVSKYVGHLREKGIKLLSPDINESYQSFTVAGGMVRYGLLAVKGLGENAVEEILAAREKGGSFTSFSDFTQRLPFASLNKRGVEGLVKSGAFDSLGYARRALMVSFGAIIDSEMKKRKQNLEGQLSFFDMLGAEDGQPIQAGGSNEPSPLPEYPLEELLFFEKEALGLYISGHPLQKYEETLSQCLASIELNPGDEDRELVDGQNAIVGGVVIAAKQVSTKSSQIMAFLSMEDMLGAFEVVVFPALYEKSITLLKKDIPLVVYGKISIKDETASIVASSIASLDDQPAAAKLLKSAKAKQAATPMENKARSQTKGDNAKKGAPRPPKEANNEKPVSEAANAGKLEPAYAVIEINKPTVGMLNEIRAIISSSPGHVRVVLHDIYTGKKFIAGESFGIDAGSQAMSQLQQTVGKEAVRLVDAAGKAM